MRTEVCVCVYLYLFNATCANSGAHLCNIRHAFVVLHLQQLYASLTYSQRELKHTYTPNLTPFQRMCHHVARKSNLILNAKC